MQLGLGGWKLEFKHWILHKSRRVKTTTNNKWTQGAMHLQWIGVSSNQEQAVESGKSFGIPAVLKKKTPTCTCTCITLWNSCKSLRRKHPPADLLWWQKLCGDQNGVEISALGRGEHAKENKSEEYSDYRDIYMVIFLYMVFWIKFGREGQEIEKTERPEKAEIKSAQSPS